MDINEFYSHPGKKLITHLKNVSDFMVKLHNQKVLSIGLQNKLLTNIGLSHDFGKFTTFFQNYLKTNVKNEKNLHFHGFISALFAGWLINKYNLGEKYYSLITFFIIKHHHGNLNNFENDFEDNIDSINIIKEQIMDIKQNTKLINKIYNIDVSEFLSNYSFFWEKLKKDKFYFLEFEPNEKKFNVFFEILYVFSLLIYSDKTDVVTGEIEEIKLPHGISNFIDNYKIKTFKKSKKNDLNLLREEAYKISFNNINKTINKNDYIFSLNLPTGAGKTLTVLNLAFSLLEKDKTLKRIIYALPFTSIIDQLELILKDIFKTNNLTPDDYLIVHHHLAEIKIKQDENYFEGDKAQFLIENWDKPIVLTTFWQLFNSIITNKNSQLRKFHNIANSVIILDEVQSIPYKYWDLTNKIFTTLTKVFNCKIIFLTATMPLIFREDKKEITPLIPQSKRNKYYKKFSRYELKIIDGLHGIKINELFEKAKDDINKNQDKSFLFVFNTIKSSIKFFNLIKGDFGDSIEKELIYLSTNILPIERKERITKIKENPKNKIIISTQLIEAGVDIDIDIVYRDFAPLDAIIQTAGRCNRNNKPHYKGKVVLFKLKNDKSKYDYQYIYKGLPLDATNSILQNKKCYAESELLSLINSFFEKIKNNSSTDPSKKILDKIKKLQYEDISNEFKLIDEIPSSLMYIEYDENATKIFEKYKNILLIDDRFKRKDEFLKIKKEFYKYVLSVTKNKTASCWLPTVRDETNINNTFGMYYIKKEILNEYYDKETGFKNNNGNII